MKHRVGILGCTGAVGQRLVQLLNEHPWFEVTVLGASDASVGHSYGHLMQRSWKLSTPIPESLTGLIVRACRPEQFQECDIVFSALDSSVAGDLGKCNLGFM